MKANNNRKIDWFTWGTNQKENNAKYQVKIINALSSSLIVYREVLNRNFSFLCQVTAKLERRLRRFHVFFEDNLISIWFVSLRRGPCKG